MPKSYRTQVFVSYSHRDREWLDKLRNVFAPHIRNDRIEYWDDQSLATGDRWQKEISNAIDHARIAVLLVSPHFLNSEFIMNQELPQVLEAEKNGLTIVWIPVFGEFCGDKTPPMLQPIAEFQAAIDISEPLAKLKSKSLNKRLLDICHQVKRLLNPARVPRKLPFPTIAELFIGRDEELATLDKHFNGSEVTITQPVALIGGGGIGKTRLALEYAFRHENDFEAYLFISANTPDDLNTNMARLCVPDALDLPENQSPNQIEQRDAVLRWLQEHHNWLLIIDNVDTDEAVASVQSLLDSLTGGQIIITTRITDWGGCAREFVIELITLKNATELLLRSTANRRIAHDDDTVHAESLAKQLGCLPLMLTHASAYIRRYCESFTGYLTAFEKKLPEVLAWHDHNAIKYEIDPTKDRVVKTVATTFFMSFDRLSAVEKALLRAAGLLASDPIPVAMFEQSPVGVLAIVKLWCEEASESISNKSIRDALADLAHVSLITQTDGAFKIHRVEQRILDCRILPPWRDKWAQAIVNLVQAYMPSDSSAPTSWPIWCHLRPHAELLCEKYENVPSVRIPVNLLEGLANLFFGKGLHSKGIPYAEKVVAFNESRYGKDNPTLLKSLHLLGFLYEGNGEYAKAESLYRRELAGWERLQGPLGEKTLIAINRLACLLGLKYDFENAELLFRRAIEGREKVLGLNDPETLKSKQDLGWMFYRKGDYAAAEPFFRNALPGLEKQLGIDHRDTLACAHNLALILEQKGELNEAEKLWKRAVSVSLKRLGSMHPNTVLFVESLKSLLLKKGEKGKTLQLQLDSILAREKEPESKNDKQLPIDLNNLALEFRESGNLDVAEPLLRRALARDRAIRGKSHPKIPHRLNNLCTVLIMKGNLREAKSLLTHAWQLKSGKHDLTSIRLLFVRLTVALLESHPPKSFLGMLKTMVDWESVPDYADVAVTWNIAYFIEKLRPQLPLGSAEFLTALASVLNDRRGHSKLDRFELWTSHPAIALETPWPEN